MVAAADLEGFFDGTLDSWDDAIIEDRDSKQPLRFQVSGVSKPSFPKPET